MERKRFDINLQWKQKDFGGEEECKLIGKVLTETRIGYTAVRDSVGAAWRLKNEVDIKMMGFNLFTFTFKEAAEAQRILEESPWVVRNYMLSLQKRKPFLSDNEVVINSCVFWVQFYNLPVEGRLGANIRLMASMVGRVLEVEDPEETRYVQKNYGRARIEIDVEKPLVPGFLAPRPDGLDDVWVQIKYEKLVRFCFNCGKLGHESKACEEETVEFVVNGATRGYDASLCAQALRRQSAAPVNRKLEQTPEGRIAQYGERCNHQMHGEKGRMYMTKEDGGSSICQEKEKWAVG